ncbi:phytoene/squalene synthase family protein [Fructilactobacillus carniphilus]|uniref:Squalene/phytoene synthase family protein n=1 Tax=Fructilactobacillus carniphilus TaxID=2940297 RepID=A0ABY5BVI7_9LACO|nr:squalene/phytoene synthase family protein [Fructilactobacillus carniphilus]USS90519.1 squalene/phytoene synthase family protein [Fructilactobacillus carniphilus]
MNRAQRLAPYLAGMAASELMIKQNSTTFYFAFSRLPKYQSLSIFVLYSFLRQLDDAADQQDAQEFKRLCQEWDDVKAGKPQSQLGMNLAIVFETFQISFQLMDEMIAGQRADLRQQRIQTMTDLRNYCYQVAGTVGLMLMAVLREESLQPAEKKAVIRVGVAMQLTNILRDVRADYLRHYLYLPQSLLMAAQIDLQFLRQPALGIPAAFSDLVKRIGRIAFSDYQCGPTVIALVPERQARLALALAIEGYQAILKKLRRRDYNVLRGRVVVSKYYKLWLLIKLKISYSI